MLLSDVLVVMKRVGVRVQEGNCDGHGACSKTHSNASTVVVVVVVERCSSTSRY